MTTEIQLLNKAENISIKELNGQRVVTFRDIDEAHQRPQGTAYGSFIRNKRYFIKNVDYYVLTRNNLPIDVKYTSGIGTINNKGLTLFTETGYLMIAKSFTDKLSWDVQRYLVNGYFVGKKMVESLVSPTNPVGDYVTKAEMVMVVDDLRGYLTRLFDMADKTNNSMASVKSSIDGQNTILWNIKKSLNESNARTNGYNPTPPNSRWTKMIGVQVAGIVNKGTYSKGKVWNSLYSHIGEVFGINLNEEKTKYCSLYNFNDTDFAMLKFLDTNDDYKAEAEKFLADMIDSLNYEDDMGEHPNDELQIYGGIA